MTPELKQAWSSMINALETEFTEEGPMYIFKVSYNQGIKYSGADGPDYSREQANVMAKNAEEAIAAVKENEMGRKEEFDSNDGKEFCEVVKVEILGVEEITSVDYQDEP